jgi:hypothetical protein
MDETPYNNEHDDLDYGNTNNIGGDLGIRLVRVQKAVH